MQFLEYYDCGLRSPVLRFERVGCSVRFRLFPTIHIAAPAYYAAVLEHLRDCDRVLYEHFENFEMGPHDHDGHRTLASRLGLVSQLDAIDYECLPATWELADFSSGHWEQAVADLPSWQDRARFTVRGQAMIQFINAFLPAPSREQLARMCDMSQTMHEELIALTPLDTMVLDDRNRVVLNALKRYRSLTLVDPTDTFIVGVFYGAAHMPALVEYLTDRLGYLCRSADWINPPAFTW